MCLKDATQNTCLALNGEIWVLHAFNRQPQVKHIHNTINWPTESMSHNVWSRFTTCIHVLRHLHWWLILHCLSKVTLWYYITPSAVIVEELNLVEASDANAHKWLQTSKLALTSSLLEAPQMSRKSVRGSQKSQLVVHISLLLIHQKTQLHIAHWANCSTQDKQTDAAKTRKKKNKKKISLAHGGSETGREAAVQDMQLFLPAEETWHSVPSKAGYRTLLSLQLLQTPLTSYPQHRKEKRSEKSHRFDRYRFLIRASGDTERGECAGGRAGERNMGKSAGRRENERRCSEQ